MARKGYENKQIYVIDFFNIDRDKIKTKDKYGYTKKTDKMTDIDKKLFVGFDLGSDFTSEHEWGIKDLLRAFGVKYDKINGIEGMRNTRVPERLHFGWRTTSRTKQKFLILAYNTPIDGYSAREIITCYRPEEIFHSGWSGNDFIIAVPAQNKRAINELQQLYTAIKKKKMVVMMGARQFINNRGLCLGLFDRVPYVVDKKIKHDQENHRIMMEYVNKLDLKGKLTARADEWFKENDKKWRFDHPWAYMALSPKKIPTYDNVKESAHPYWYWLNPHNQQHVNSGWFTAEEIEQWLEGKGPIPKDNWKELL